MKKVKLIAKHVLRDIIAQIADNAPLQTALPDTIVQLLDYHMLQLAHLAIIRAEVA